MAPIVLEYKNKRVLLGYSTVTPSGFIMSTIDDGNSDMVYDEKIDPYCDEQIENLQHIIIPEASKNPMSEKNFDKIVEYLKHYEQNPFGRYYMKKVEKEETAEEETEKVETAEEEYKLMWCGYYKKSEKNDVLDEFRDLQPVVGGAPMEQMLDQKHIWYAEFLKGMTPLEVINLLNAANYFGIESLVHLTSAKLSEFFVGNNLEAIVKRIETSICIACAPKPENMKNNVFCDKIHKEINISCVCDKIDTKKTIEEIVEKYPKTKSNNP